MPAKADEMNKQIGMAEGPLSQGMKSLKEWGQLKAGGTINLGDQLFPRIDVNEKKENVSNKIRGEKMNDLKTDEKNKKENSNEPSETNLIGFEEFVKLDLRVGKITEAERIKKSKKLIKLKVDIGNEVRQVVAGIATSYSPEEIIGKSIILVANLKPAKLMGIESQGMILAANSGEKITLAGFHDDLEPGIKVK
jgi:methionyl-tRNA synthetase